MEVKVPVVHYVECPRVGCGCVWVWVWVGGCGSCALCRESQDGEMGGWGWRLCTM